MKWSSPSLWNRLRPDGMGEFRVSGISLLRKWPTLSTMKPSRRWGTRLWWYGQMLAIRPLEDNLKMVPAVLRNLGVRLQAGVHLPGDAATKDWVIFLLIMLLPKTIAHLPYSIALPISV